MKAEKSVKNPESTPSFFSAKTKHAPPLALGLKILFGGRGIWPFCAAMSLSPELHGTNGAGLAPQHKLLTTTWKWSLSPILNVTEAPIPMWSHSASDGCPPPTDREVGSCSSYAEVAGRMVFAARAAAACVNRGGASPFPRSLPSSASSSHDAGACMGS